MYLLEHYVKFDNCWCWTPKNKEKLFRTKKEAEEYLAKQVIRKDEKIEILDLKELEK